MQPVRLLAGDAKTEKWRAQGDDLRTFLVNFVAALPQIEFPAGLSSLRGI
jgi:hypothetical protein